MLESQLGHHPRSAICCDKKDLVIHYDVCPFSALLVIDLCNHCRGSKERLSAYCSFLQLSQTCAGIHHEHIMTSCDICMIIVMNKEWCLTAAQVALVSSSNLQWCIAINCDHLLDVPTGIWLSSWPICLYANQIYPCSSKANTISLFYFISSASVKNSQLVAVKRLSIITSKYVCYTAEREKNESPKYFSTWIPDMTSYQRLK